MEWISYRLTYCLNYRYIEGSKHSSFSKKTIWIGISVFRFLLRYTNLSFISLSVGDTPTYWGCSLVEQIITRIYFVMQSEYFFNFRIRHNTYNFCPCKIVKIYIWNRQLNKSRTMAKLFGILIYILYPKNWNFFDYSK